MTPEAVGPLTRIVDVVNIPPTGKHVRIEASVDECRALARDFGLPDIRDLSGEFNLTTTAKGVHVHGTVKAGITQVCVVSLDSFDSTIEEEVEVDFAEPSGMPAEPPTEMHDYEPPDEIVNGQIDLGALTAEFLALGLDPYPRKPGISFDYKDPRDAKDSPFAALDSLKEKD
ncbi:YceD family protein [Microvirga rosea]|uniref:YceD family protein n=1 Tax=Microvirga rosea TaxID=2715425 RepID=UPI001D0A1EFE|nr:YceD family protein [Microvirga rosea]MCB8820930.1 YceD family protein [Microvirga rosea]